jgi:hypothetical protein
MKGAKDLLVVPVSSLHQTAGVDQLLSPSHSKRLYLFFQQICMMVQTEAVLESA